MQLQARSEASNHAVCGELSYVAYLYFSGMHYSIVGCVRDLAARVSQGQNGVTDSERRNINQVNSAMELSTISGGKTSFVSRKLMFTRRKSLVNLWQWATEYRQKKNRCLLGPNVTC